MVSATLSHLPGLNSALHTPLSFEDASKMIVSIAKLFLLRPSSFPVVAVAALLLAAVSLPDLAQATYADNG
jgi:hypothetical protein